MKREIVLYDNTNLYEHEEEVRNDLFFQYAQDYDWQLPGDVPDKMVEEEINFRDEMDWLDLRFRLENMLSNGHFLLVGYCGRWNGRADGGKFISSYSELMSCLNHLVGMRFTDIDGHLIIDGYHHDGSDRYELKKLTSKGILYADRNYFANDRHLHETIMNCNFYSRLPRLASL